MKISYYIIGLKTQAVILGSLQVFFSCYQSICKRSFVQHNPFIRLLFWALIPLSPGSNNSLSSPQRDFLFVASSLSCSLFLALALALFLSLSLSFSLFFLQDRWFLVVTNVTKRFFLFWKEGKSKSKQLWNFKNMLDTFWKNNRASLVFYFWNKILNLFLPLSKHCYGLFISVLISISIAWYSFFISPLNHNSSHLQKGIQTVTTGNVTTD